MGDQITEPEAIPKRSQSPHVGRDWGSRRSRTRGTRRITVEVPSSLYERIANALFWHEGLSLNAFARQAFTQYVETLERDNGGLFEERKKTKRYSAEGKRKVDIFA